MGQSGGTDRSIRAQLNRIVLIPSVTFLVLFAVLSTGTLTQAVSLRVATGDGRSSVHLYHAVAEFQKERRTAAEYLGSPSEETLQALRRQISVTDNAVREIEARGDGLRGRGDATAAEAASGFFAALDGRNELRDHVMSGDFDTGTAIAAYDGIVDRGIRVYDALGRLLEDGPSASASADAVDLMRAQDHFTRADALLSGTITVGELAPEEQTRFAALIADLRQRMGAIGPSLRGEAARAHEDLVESGHWGRLNDLADEVVEYDLAADAERADGEDQGAGEPPPALDQWRAAADETNADITVLTDSQAHEVISATDAVSAWMFTLAFGGGIIALFASTVAYGAASKSAARLTHRLARLRAETLELSRDELPRIVRRLENGEHVDPDTEMRQLDHGTDEVGQVADAFNIAQRTAVAAAVKQAEVREGANRVFLGIAHRNQSLVQRQLRLLDRVEREEDDPDLLENLFHLDHLATRGRRNAENLIILGGQQPGRKWRSPIPLVDILRGAISETEEYARVKLQTVPGLSLSGSVVADVIHLLSELVENATAFSPPHTSVHIRSETVPKGVVVEIEDRGLGMSEQDLAGANRTLSEVPEFDVMALNQDARLGLFVVARLAAKHRVHVQMCPSPYGGTRAIVLVPSGLIASGEAPARTPAEVRAAESESPREEGPGDLLAAQRMPGRPRVADRAGGGSLDRSEPPVREEYTAPAGLAPDGAGARDGRQEDSVTPRNESAPAAEPPPGRDPACRGDVPVPR
ncbi:sensor histidine kinase [Allosalinactinospora lopnorensis]|uniref:sensor histidine kinase n=1 Tax=Allosalinactinospora lopnorensis TaxID=1352348 RepID=UPI000A948D63|nr:nitrate- and nitrite sensing domain-containing protein [Allosalinactinospora lopnorensis]